MKLFQDDARKIVKRVVDYGLSTAYAAGEEMDTEMIGGN